MVECTTIQSLPPKFHARAAAAVASLCADDGTVVVIARKTTGHDAPGPPRLLTEDEIREFAVDGVVLESHETQRRRLVERVGVPSFIAPLRGSRRRVRDRELGSAMYHSVACGAWTAATSV